MVQSDSAKKLLIFISHASEDTAETKELTDRLMADGFDPWFDRDRLLPGQDWNLEIKKALRASDVILLCFSEVSVAKEGYIQREYKQAMDYQKEKPEGVIYVIPVRLDDCEVPDLSSELQWVDYPDGYDKLFQALQIRAGGKAMTPKPAPKKETPKKGENDGTPSFVFNAPVTIAGDFVGRDQHKTTNTINNYASPAEFITELQKLMAEIEALKAAPNVDSSDKRQLEVAVGDVGDAIAESEKEKPDTGKIEKFMNRAKKTMEDLGGSVTAAVQLGSTIANLAMLIKPLFGG